MPYVSDEQPQGSGPKHWFTTTHWSVVLAAAEGASPTAAAALDKLCQTYSYPLYAFARRLGKDEQTAQDSAQSFLERLLERNYLGQAQRTKGKFRTFILTCFKNFMADEWDKVQAQKRGGRIKFLSLDETPPEGRYRLEPEDSITPEKLFERCAALTLIEQARQRLREEYEQDGKAALYERLKVFEDGDKRGPPYAELALELGCAVGTVKSYVSRLRERFRALLLQEVANTVDSPEEIADEIRHLIAVFSG